MKRVTIVAATIAVLAIAAFVFWPHPAPPLPIKTLDPWILQTNDPKALVHQPGDMPDDLYGTYIGNGYIGAVIGPEGVGTFNGQPTACVMAGLWEGENTKALPNWSDFPLFDEEGKRFVLDTNAPYRQTLNMREGYVETELTLRSGRKRLAGKVILFISKSASPNIAAIRYELTPSFSGPIKADGSLNNSGWKSLPGRQRSADIFIGETETHQAVAIRTFVYAPGPTTRRGFTLGTSKGVPTAFTKYVFIAGPARSDVATAADRTLMSQLSGAADIGRGSFDKLFAAHKQAWRDSWKSDIIISGDPEAQQTIHAMMFYLLCSASRDNSISPIGLSGEGPWRGHIFWDADTWMLPALVLQYPDIAGGIDGYRFDTAIGALRNAGKAGYDGLQIAWESARTGIETAPAPYDQERHVTADAALAAYSTPYWGWSIYDGPVRLDKKTGKMVSLGPTFSEQDLFIIHTSEYWASRVKYNKAQDRYEILDVVPPDENAGIVDSSVYTNAAAKRNIEIAIEMAKEVGARYPAKWDDIVKKMYIPFDAKNTRFLAYDGYKGGETKQADTELLIYPLVYPMSEEVKRNTFDFYKKTTDPRGPAMTSSIHAIIAAELGRPDEAYQHFQDSYKPFLRGPMMMFNEKRSMTYDNRCFLTGCAGTIQSVLYGFGGLRVGRAPEGFNQLLPGLYCKPCLPEKWTKLQITDIKWGGKRYDLTILPGNKWDLVEKK